MVRSKGRVVVDPKRDLGREILDAIRELKRKGGRAPEVRYTDEPMKVGRIIPDFLPPPDKLIFTKDAVRVTLSLSARSVQYFKAESAKQGVPYPQVIRGVLDAYADTVTALSARRRKRA